MITIPELAALLELAWRKASPGREVPAHNAHARVLARAVVGKAPDQAATNGPEREDPARTVVLASSLRCTLRLAAAHAQPLPQPKVGPCPSGYTESGGYCAPMRRDAPVAIPKVPVTFPSRDGRLVVP